MNDAVPALKGPGGTQRVPAELPSRREGAVTVRRAGRQAALGTAVCFQLLSLTLRFKELGTSPRGNSCGMSPGTG